MRNGILGMIFVLVACAHGPSRTAQAGAVVQPHFAGIDIYGTDRVSMEEAKSILSGKLETCIQLYMQNDYEKYFGCKAEFTSALQKKYGFASVDLGFIGYYLPGARPAYGTIDVVEAREAKARMNFIPRPKKSFSDPDGLIQAWTDYQKLGFELLARGEILAARASCPAFHCLFGHQHPALQPYEKIFVEGVAKNREKLIEIFRFDSNDQHRGIAPFLLAYQKDGPQLVEVLSERLRDESDFVRNNVTRVFSDMAMFQSELSLPLKELAKVLNFPATTDRNKASILFQGIATNKVLLEKHRSLMMKEVVPILLKMLRLQQPNNHDPAYTTLRLISGQSYGERDYAAWEDWYQRMTQASKHSVSR